MLAALSSALGIHLSNDAHPPTNLGTVSWSLAAPPTIDPMCPMNTNNNNNHNNNNINNNNKNESWAGASLKGKKVADHDHGRVLGMSPSMPSLDITGTKIEGHKVGGNSIQQNSQNNNNHNNNGNNNNQQGQQHQTIGTPKTDIRSNKQSNPILKNSSTKQLLQRGGGTVGPSTFRRNLEISGDSIDLRSSSGPNTAMLEQEKYVNL
eukprot:CAMPEP_0174825566 /NCGR_PEP_ID=MMETSP1107-20130205/42877_1 /TAXON_ID=36770 /ORGANISM="Paraphysomonas vestita, Strain GFlagA" /LENGTH=206 /DNA_ID=CAMNT_0016057295 /DNA_START=42 /DNA_END=663 /DNA_ORIENTATION=+